MTKWLGENWYHQLLGLIIVLFYIYLVHKGNAPADGFCILATGIIKDIFSLMQTNANNASNSTTTITTPTAAQPTTEVKTS
jgi:hypothetical protein